VARGLVRDLVIPPQGAAGAPNPHVLDSATHTISGKSAGQILAATGATTFAFVAVEFTKGGVFFDPTGARNAPVWRAPHACTVTNVRGYRVGGTGATVNARKNGTLDLLAAALSLTAADSWMDGGAVQNTALAAGDKLEVMLVSVAGSPTEVTIEVDLTRP
jgi:hypothetical protein